MTAERVKYPRTLHVPWSLGVQNDDRVIDSMSSFEGRRVVVTTKMDGENTSMYRHAIHARSLDSRHHPSRDWVKKLWSSISSDIPDGWRIVGENLFAVHSIEYANLPSLFMAFSVWNDSNECLAWDETVEWCSLLGLERVPVLYVGEYDESMIRRSVESSIDLSRDEGYVIRLYDSFRYEDFGRSVAKFVRANHVQTDEHWSVRPMVQNRTME